MTEWQPSYNFFPPFQEHLWTYFLIIYNIFSVTRWHYGCSTYSDRSQGVHRGYDFSSVLYLNLRFSAHIKAKKSCIETWVKCQGKWKTGLATIWFIEFTMCDYFKYFIFQSGPLPRDIEIAIERGRKESAWGRRRGHPGIGLSFDNKKCSQFRWIPSGRGKEKYVRHGEMFARVVFRLL